ncbi:MAG: haloacid dehalogenase-like hydrolase [Deltaproteobacteria bacterium]|nr:haloacid dehalogenase-like hydrolase [Deltaproteobacteria bacterium]
MAGGRPTIVLFDVDGTLVQTGGAGRRAMEHGFAQVTGRPDACTGFSLAGMTDRAIARAGLRAVGTADTEAAIDAVLAAYLGALDRELAGADGYRVLDGVVELLAALAGRPDLAVGLGTGNLRDGARLKLARGNLWRCFGFGGFGCDAEDRVALVRAGAERGAQALGAPLDHCAVWVVGDTARDVNAAHGNGFFCLAVASGGADLAALRQCGPRAAVATLADSAVVSLLSGAA